MRRSASSLVTSRSQVEPIFTWVTSSASIQSSQKRSTGSCHLVGEVPHRGEHVDGEALEGPVHAGQPEHRVGVAGGLEERDGLAVLADLGAHVVAELHRDLDVAGLVPALAGHVELQREAAPRRHGVVVGACGRRPRGPGSRRRRCRASGAGPGRPRRRPSGPSGGPRRGRARSSAKRSAVVIRWNRSSRARDSGGSCRCMGERVLRIRRTAGGIDAAAMRHGN